MQPLALYEETTCQLLNHYVNERALFIEAAFFIYITNNELVVNQSSNYIILHYSFQVRVVFTQIFAQLNHRKLPTALQCKHKLITMQLKHSSKPHPYNFFLCWIYIAILLVLLFGFGCCEGEVDRDINGLVECRSVVRFNHCSRLINFTNIYYLPNTTY